MAKKFTKWHGFLAAQGLFVALALVLSIVSSLTAYAVRSLPLIAGCCAAVILLDLAALFAADRLPSVVVDGIFFIAALLMGFSLCTMVSGRVLLMGYIYFSDLESSNPVAILAMNLAIASWVFYALAIAANCGLGLCRRDKA